MLIIAELVGGTSSRVGMADQQRVDRCGRETSVGYGASGSRYEEEKRVVVNKDLGPLISTDMTRCIHCTRCVRFGTEIAGIMELGMIGRGEHAEIITFVGRTVDSELS